TLRKVFQQAIDQYPRLAAFLLMLPGVTPEAVQRFHNSVYQQVSELAVTRQLSGRPVPPTVLRWIWAFPPGQTGRMLLLRDAVSSINDVRHHQPPEITVFRVDRTHPSQADTQYSRLRECALSLIPAVTARSERISP
ncbi:TPA: hypothetical protein N2E47_004701, partial [Salmonella enterica]|nr:hypothetical protein [Salmonella enterica]HCL4786696.1 hypothetical protein [Salmonella enterica]